MALTTYPAIALTSGAANTKGSYTQIVASTPYASSRLYLSPGNLSTFGLFALIDLATGGAGTESVVLANLSVSVPASTTVVGTFVAIDVDIPAGTRLAARCQSVSAAITLTLDVVLEDRALASVANPVTYGATVGSSTGTALDPGGTINTKGSYVELSASTSARIDAVVLCFTINSQGLAVAASQTWKVDLATGAGGAETVVIPDLRLVSHSAVDVPQPALVRLAVSIPAGTRLAARCECTVSTVTQRNLRITAIGLQEPASGGSGAGAVAYVG